MSWTKTTPRCRCRCGGLPAISIEYKSYTGTVAQAAGFGAWDDIPWGGGKDHEGHFTGAAEVARIENYLSKQAPAGGGKPVWIEVVTATAVRARVTCISDGLPVRLRLRAAIAEQHPLASTSFEDEHPSPAYFTFSIESVVDQLATGPAGETMTVWEGNVPMPPAPAAGRIWVEDGGEAERVDQLSTFSSSTLIGAPAGPPFEIGRDSWSATMSKQGFHAYQEKFPAPPRVFKLETAGAKHQRFFYVAPADAEEGFEPDSMYHYERSFHGFADVHASVVFPDWRVPAVGSVQSPTERVLTTDEGDPVTFNLSEEYTKSELLGRVDHLVDTKVFTFFHPQHHAVRLLTSDEVTYQRARSELTVSVPPFGIYNTGDVSLTLRWKRSTRDLTTGIAAVTDGTLEVTARGNDDVGIGDPLHPMELTLNQCVVDPIDPIAVDTVANQSSVHLSHFAFDPVDSLASPIILEEAAED